MRPQRFSARWVLPVTAAPIADGALLVGEDGRIVAVGPRTAVPLAEDALDIDLGEAALLPGLVNTHAHPELSYLRGRLEDLEFAEWIATLLERKRDSGLDDAARLAAARWTCIEALAAGITTLAATEDSGATLDALVESGQRGILFHETFGPAPEQADVALATLRDAVGVLRDRETDLVRVGVSPHAPFSVSDVLFTRVAAFARERALPIAVHAAESRAERALVCDGRGTFAERLNARGIATPPRGASTIELLQRLGVLDAKPLLIHCVTVDAADIARIAASQATVAHCPVANARLGHGTAPLPALLDAGIVVGLGTDSVASNNRLDLLGEARAAQLLQRATRGDAAVLPAERLLRLATLDGARALGLDNRIGALEPGLDADLCAVSLSRAHVRPVHDPVAALFHSAHAGDVVLTVVQGRVLYRDGEWTTLDLGQARTAIEAIADRARRPARPAS